MIAPGLLLVNIFFIWGSAILFGVVLKWRLPIPLWAGLVFGILLWIAGLLFAIQVTAERRRLRRGTARSGTHLMGLVAHPFATTRLMMNLGMALAFRSWVTLIIAILLYPMYTLMAKRRRSALSVNRRQLENLRRNYGSGRFRR